MPKRAALLLLAGVLWLGGVSSASADDAAAAKSFVQGFYDWYAAGRPAPDKALRERPDAFGDDLKRALSPGGIDFDPFIAGDAPCDRYTAGEAFGDGATFRVNVYSPCYSPEQEMPDVIAIVAWQGGAWRFTNFEYPEDGNLLEMLRQAAESRAPAP
jgi:hypothetical protein